MNAVWYMLGRPDERDVAPLSASPSDALFIFAIYHKGSVFLRTVEEHVGEAPFTEALRSLVARGPGHHTIDGFVSAVQTASGIDVTPLLNDWMRAPGYPSLTVSPSIAGQELSLTIAMDESFDLDVPVRVRLADGSETWTTVALTPGVSTTTMPFAWTLASVEVDPRWTMSRRVVPALRGDVSLDGRVDGADLIEVALRSGGAMPDTRRVDGHYDPLYDVDGDLAIGDADLDAIIEAAR